MNPDDQKLKTELLKILDSKNSFANKSFSFFSIFLEINLFIVNFDNKY